MVRQETGTRAATGDVVVQGALGGLVGGMIMAMIMMIVTAAMGMGLLRPLYLIAATVHQPWAMANGVALAPLIIGLMIHMLNSAIFGIIFVLLLRAVTRHSGVGAASGAVVGMAWGALVLVINQTVVLPLVDPAMASATAGMLLWWTVSHLMYGLVLGAIVAHVTAPGTVAGATTRAAI
ncbi:MAG: hypothetical protein NVSMB65_04820 [Chloroflexota bacterium]